MKIKITLLISLCFLISKAQTVTTVLEGNFQDGLAIDASGNLYGSEFSGTSVYKYDTNGNVSVFKDGFQSPNGIGIDPNGAIYICDHYGNTIYKYDDSGTLLNTYGGLTSPAGIKNIPGTNDMLIVEYNTDKIKILDSASDTISDLNTLPQYSGPAGIAFINGETYIGAFNTRKIFKIINNFTIEEVAQLPANAAQKNWLGFLTAFDGNLYATQIGEGKIYKINPDNGDVSLFAGSVLGNMDGSLDTATFNEPNGILADDVNNRIFVSDGITRNLRVIENLNLGVESPNSNGLDFKLFPNPAFTKITLKWENTFDLINTELTITDVSGKIVYSSQLLQEDNIIIDVSKLEQGTYIVKVVNDRKSHTIKFIK